VLRRIVIVLILFVPAAWTVMGLVSLTRQTLDWRAPADPLREEIEARVPRGGTVDIVMLTPGARERAVFLGADLHPRDVRFFEGWEAWRARRRAIFMHDARAVNAPPGPPPGPPHLVVEIGEKARIVRPR
jgi:hypothetical protein